MAQVSNTGTYAKGVISKGKPVQRNKVSLTTTNGKALVSLTPSTQAAPVPVGTKAARSKVRQSNARLQAKAARIAAKAQGKGAKAQLKAQAAIAALPAPATHKAAPAPKAKKLPIKVKGLTRCKVQGYQKVWASGTAQYTMQPVTLTGYVLQAAINTAQVYIPAKGNTPAYTLTASVQGYTGVPLQWAIIFTW